MMISSGKPFKNWETIHSIKSNGLPMRQNKKTINSFNLIKLLLENKQTFLTEISIDNGALENHHNVPFEYSELTVKDKDCKPCENYVAQWPFGKDPETGYKQYFQTVFFDFESTTDGEIHRPYLVCDSRKKSFSGKNCALNWLKSLTVNTLAIAHNLRYDVQFLMKYLSNARDLIMTGNKIKQIKGDFICGSRIIHLVFKDSYSMISMPLRDFPKMFGSEMVKDVMPYEAYNEETVKLEALNVEYAASFLSESDREIFLHNIQLLGLITKDGKHFYHMDYARFYCQKDVDVLENGYNTFRKWMLEATKIDINNMLSIPQLANKFGLDQGVFENTYKLSGVPREFIQRCVAGGRVMTRDNKKFSVNKRVADFDGVSLYPSAMSRLPGFLIGKPKVITKEMLANFDEFRVGKDLAYFVEINVLDVGIDRHFPLLSKKDKAGIRQYDNEIRGNGIYVDNIGLEDLIEFQDVKYEVIRGYYFDEGYNTKIIEFIQFLFDERLKKKAEGNPIQNVYKLIMNAFYGKLIIKCIHDKTCFKYGAEACAKYLSYNFGTITELIKITKTMTMFKEKKPIHKHFSMPHLGVQVLAMSKRIMNEVICCLGEDNIYYQDTDSMHVDEDKVEPLAAAYKEKYGLELIGSKLGQFHCDFANKSTARPPVSVQSIYLGKKSYIDKVECVNLVDDMDAITYEHHMRMKGIPGSVLQKKIDSEFHSIPMDMYRHLLNGNAIEFDLLSCCKFKSQSNFTTVSNTIFKRTLSF